MRYLLHPGLVTSKNDGDTHFIGTGELAQLYGVSPADCWIAGRSPEQPGDVHLFPRYDGDYTLPSPLTLTDGTEIPGHIIASARRVSQFFAEQNIKEWALDGCQNRKPK